MQAVNPTDMPPAPLSIRIGARVATIGIVIGTVALIFFAFRRPGMVLDEVVKESFWFLEWSQVIVWTITGLVAAWAVTRQRSGRMILLATWFGVISIVAGMRELDLHVVLNPANIHLLGLEESQAVRFRLDWWTDSETPVGLRVVWGIILGAAGAIMIGPLLLARYPWFSRLLRREMFAWLIAIGFGGLAAAYVLDDILGRPLSKVGISVGLVEEISELAGQCCVLAGVALLALRPPAKRGEPGQSTEVSTD